MLNPGSGMGKKSGFGVRENISDYISKSLVTIFWVKNTSIPSQLSDPDPGWKNPDPGSGMEKSTSDTRDKHSGSATLQVQFSFLKKGSRSASFGSMIQQNDTVTRLLYRTYPVDIFLVALEVFLPLKVLPAVVAPEGPIRLMAQVRHLTRKKEKNLSELA